MVEIVDMLAKLDERLARQDEILAQMATMLGRMDERLAKQDTTVRHLGDLMAACHHEAAAAHQASAAAMLRFAEVQLALDTTLQALRRERP